MMRRFQQLAMIVGICFLVTAASGCSGGGGGGGAGAAGGTQLSITGTWDVSIFSSNFSGSTSGFFSLVQSGSSISGTFIEFDDFGVIASGTLVGTRSSDLLLLTLTEAGGCITMVTAVVSGDTIFGSWASCSDTGTFTAVRSGGGNSVSIGGSWDGTLTSSQAGAGALRVELFQNGSSISGIWSSDFAGISNPDDEVGTLTGVLIGDTLTITLVGDCTYMGTATVSGNVISGTYSSDCGDSGSFTLVWSGEVTPSVDGTWEGPVFSNNAGGIVGSINVTIVNEGFGPITQECCDLSGTWFTFDDFGVVTGGTLVGSISGHDLGVVLTAVDSCTDVVSGTVSGDTITGQFASQCDGDTGTFTLTKL